MEIERISIDSQVNVARFARIKGGIDLEMCKIILRHENGTPDIDDIDAAATMNLLCRIGAVKHNMLDSYEFWTPVK